MDPSHPTLIMLLEAMIRGHEVTQQMIQIRMQHVESKDPKKALLLRSEQHRLRFRSLTLSEVGNTFEFGQLLSDNCHKWLMVDRDPRRIVEWVAMEQFVVRLPEATGNWVQNHQPATLIEAVRLASNHLASLSLPTVLMSCTECYIMDFSHHPEIMQLLEVLKQAQAVTQQNLQSMQQEKSKDLKKAILQWSEQQHQLFRSLTFDGDVGHLFVFALLLLDCCEKWLLPEDCDPERIVNQVVMEQFFKHLPEGTTHWVLQHQPATLNEVIYLVENHRPSFSPHLP